VKRILISGAALALAVSGVGIGSADPGSPRGGSGSVACNDGTVTWDPTTIWPPNHKMQTVNIGYTSGEDDLAYDSSSITVDLIMHDQILADGTEMNGSGNTPIDFTGVGNSGSGGEGDTVTTSVEVRQERSGREQDGRTYTITVTCSDYDSNTGLLRESDQVDLTVAVPHDQRRQK
jgi:hypothetical protein